MHAPHAAHVPIFARKRVASYAVLQVIRWQFFASDFGPRDGLGTPEFWSEYARCVRARVRALSAAALRVLCFLFEIGTLQALITMQLHDADDLSSCWHRQDGSCWR